MRLETRAIEIVSQDDEKREIVGRIAPYDESADLGIGLEMYARGAFGSPDPSRIPLKLETGHAHAGPVVGVTRSLDDRDDALYGTFEVAETRDGDDALRLARMGALGLSAGFLIDEGGSSYERSTNTHTIESAQLREVTLTGTPAYIGAELVEIRSRTTTEVDTMPETTETTTPDVAEMIDAAVTRAVDETRSAITASNLEALETEQTLEAESRGHEYRSIGEMLVDMNLHARNKSPESSERLTRSIDLGLVEADGSALNLATRASFPNPPNPGNSVGQGVAFDRLIPDLLELLREGRPVADLFVSRSLPTIGNNVFMPEVSVGNTVDYQEAQGDEVDNTVQTQVVDDWPKATIAGGQGISIQASLWTDPSYSESVVSDLMAAYSEFLDGETINGDGIGTHHEGILTAGATDVPVGGDHAAAIALVGTAWAAVYAGSRRSPIAACMNSVDWGGFLDEVDADGRPLVTTDAPSNPAGIGNAASIAGTLRSIPVVLDDNIAAGNVIIGSFRDAVLFEDSERPAQIALTFPSVLVTDVTVYGFSALAIRRPAAFAVLSGIV